MSLAYACLKFFKTSKKLTRSDVIFEFSSSNSNISLDVTMECRQIELLIPAHYPNITSYFPFQMDNFLQDCSGRGLNEDCITTIEGKKCECDRAFQQTRF